MPPPAPAWLPETVQLISCTYPLLAMPPPALVVVFDAIVASSMYSVPPVSLKMPPPGPAEFPL